MLNKPKVAESDWQERLKMLGVMLSTAIIFALCSTSAMAAGAGNVPPSSVSFHGADIQNTADFSSYTAINKNNVANLKLKSYYIIPPAPQGPRHRGQEEAVGHGIAVSDNGIAFVPITDGRIIKLDVNNTSGTNADGTPIPVVLDTYDLVADSRYTGTDPLDGDDISQLRIHPTLANGTIYTGNYKDYAALDSSGNFDFQQIGMSSPLNGFSTKEKGAVLFAIDANTGNLKWKTVVNDYPDSMINSNPIVYNGVVYVGTATQMSGTMSFLPWWYSLFPGIDPFLQPGNPVEKSSLMYRGNFVGVDEKTGKVLFTTYFIPKQKYRTRAEIDAKSALDLYMGVSVWGGGNPSIDTKRNLIFVGTGEAYASPLTADQCEQDRLAQPGASPFDPKCLGKYQDQGPNDPDVGALANVVEAPGVNSPNKPLPDAVVAMDLKTGAIKWGTPLNGFDIWSLGALTPVFGAYFPIEFIPTTPPYLRGANFGLNFYAKDLDIAEMPIFVKNVKMGNGKGQDLVIATTKAAKVAALNPDDGSIIWDTYPFGPGGLLSGGILWGSATDGKYLFTRSTVSDLNIADLNNPAKKVVPGSCPVSAFDETTGQLAGGIYAAIDLKDGTIAWQRCLTAPLVDTATMMPKLDANGNQIEAPGLTESSLTYANGVLYVPGPGTPYATDFYQETILRPYMYALDATTGQTLARFPMNLDGQKVTFSQKYERPTVKNNMLIFGNGVRNSPDRSRDRRVVIYQLPKQ